MIKIITGIRRCGKSFLLFELFHDYLNSIGVDEDHIIEIALDDRAKDDKARRDYLAHLADTVFIADVVERHRVKNKPELEELFRILASSIGSPCNPTKLSNTFKSLKNVAISNKTISNYLLYLQDAFLVEKALKYNIKGKKYINTLAKYYFTDMGLRNALLGFRQLEQTHLMENIIYNELLFRGYSVDVGMVELATTDKNGKFIRKQFEVDFVVNDSDQRYYIQSAFVIPDEEKKRQETASFRNIHDSFKRVVVVKEDITPYRDENGDLFVGLFDFLLNPELLIKG